MQLGRWPQGIVLDERTPWQCTPLQYLSNERKSAVQRARSKTPQTSKLVKCSSYLLTGCCTSAAGGRYTDAAKVTVDQAFHSAVSVQDGSGIQAYEYARHEGN